MNAGITVFQPPNPRVFYCSRAAAAQATVDTASLFGGGTVRVLGGMGDLGVALTWKSNVYIECEPGSTLKFESAGSSNPVIGYAGATLTSVAAFTGTVARHATAATLASGGSNFATGDLLAMVKGGSVWQVLEVRGVASNDLTFYQGFNYPFTTAFTAHKIAAPLVNVGFKGTISNPDGNTTAAAIQVTGVKGMKVEGDFATSVVISEGLYLDAAYATFRGNYSSFYSYDVRFSSDSRMSNCRTICAPGIFGTRHYHCTDVVSARNSWHAGARIETYDASRDIKLVDNSGTNYAGAGSTGLTFADSDPLAGFRPGYVKGTGIDIHNAGENLVFFAEWNDVDIENSDFRDAATQSITIAANCTVRLHNVRRDVIGIDSTAVVKDNLGWQTWTPTVTQSGVLSLVSATVAEYRYDGDDIVFNTEIGVTTPTGAVAGNDIEISLPVAAKANWHSNNLIIGDGSLFEASSGSTHRAHAQLSTNSGKVCLASTASSTSGFLGSVSPFNAVLEANDFIRVQGRYRPA